MSAGEAERVRAEAGLRYLAKHQGKLKVQALVRTKGSKTAFLSHAFTLKGPKPRGKK